MARKIEVQIVADDRDAVRAFRNLGQESSGLGRKLGKAGLLGVVGVLGGGIAGLGIAAKLGFDEFSEAAKVGAQTGAVLKSTGGAANVTRKQIEQLAGALAAKSGMDDEAIQSGQNLLLTFTNVRNEAGKGNKIFDQTTAIMADMSVALGQDTKSSAIQLGKALNDPIKGVTALQRVGVSFTAAQKDQIKSLVESGRAMDAQKLILAELNKEFGGSAEAAGKTFPGMINRAREAALNYAGDLVGKVMPHVQAFAEELITHAPRVKAIVGDAFDTIGQVAKDIFPAVKNTIVDAFTVVRSIAQAVWPQVKTIISGVANVIRDNVIPIIGRLKDIAVETWKRIAVVLKENEPEIKRITGGIKTVIEAVGTVLLWLANTVVIPILKPLLTTVLPVALGFTIKAVDALVTVIGKVRDAVVWVRDNFVAAWGTVRAKVGPIINGLADLFGKVAGFIEDIIDGARWIIDNAKKLASALGSIASTSTPSQRFWETGGDGVISAAPLANRTISPTLWDELGMAQAMGLALSSGYRPGAITSTGNPSLHGMFPAKAIDVSGSAASMTAFARAVAGRAGIRELIYTPVGAWYPGVGWTRPSGSVAADHYDHVHVGSFDQGGWLLPGLTLARNDTGRAERILGPGEAGGTIEFVINLDSREIARGIYDPLRDLANSQARIGRGLNP